MKKVLVINTTFDKGGAARIARSLFEGSKSDFEMFFAYGRGKRVEDKKVFKFGSSIETLIHIFFVRFLGLEGFGCYFSTKKLISFIKREKFDLIHLHNLHGYYLDFFMLAKFIKKEKIPVVWTLHDEWPITWLPAHRLGCEHCKTGVGQCINTYPYPKNYFPVFSRFMLKKKKEVFGSGWDPIIVCPSKWLAQNISDSFLGKYVIKVISNGIDTRLFVPVADKGGLRVKHGLPENKKIILFAASNLNDASKGITHIVAAAKFLEYKDYLFVGLGAGKIEEMANLKALGYIYDKKELAEIYAFSDIFCFASGAETFLLSAAEALSSGVPVVGFDLPVVRELVTADTGVLVNLGDDEGLAGAIDALLGHEDKLSAMGFAGRQLIENNYSEKKFYADYSGLYHKLLN